MTEPIVNTSIKSFKQIKGRPAVSRTSNYYDWGVPKVKTDAVKKGLFNAPTGITSALKQIGTDPSYMISLPCKEINDLPNKRINRGKGKSFNSQRLNAQPYTGMDNIAFDPKMRIGTFGFDPRQKPFTFSSFQLC